MRLKMYLLLQNRLNVLSDVRNMFIWLIPRPLRSDIFFKMIWNFFRERWFSLIFRVKFPLEILCKMSIIWVPEDQIFRNSSNFLEFLNVRFIIPTLGILRIDVNLGFCQRNSENFVFWRKSQILPYFGFFVKFSIFFLCKLCVKWGKNTRKSQYFSIISIFVKTQNFHYSFDRIRDLHIF